MYLSGSTPGFISSYGGVSVYDWNRDLLESGHELYSFVKSIYPIQRLDESTNSFRSTTWQICEDCDEIVNISPISESY